MVDIWFHGQACFRVKGKNATVVFDPYDANFTGLAELKISADVVCVSHNHADHNNSAVVTPCSDEKPSGPLGPQGREPFIISGPGEYEIMGANIMGVSSFHDDKEGLERGKNTIYHLTIDDVNIVHLGDLGQKKLTQDQVEELSTCDVLLIPVGSVFTISGNEAPGIISQIEPSVIIPMHYKLPGLKFDLEGVETFLSAMGKEGTAPVSKFSISKEKLPEEPEIILLEKQ